MKFCRICSFLEKLLDFFEDFFISYNIKVYECRVSFIKCLESKCCFVKLYYVGGKMEERENGLYKFDIL